MSSEVLKKLWIFSFERYKQCFDVEMKLLILFKCNHYQKNQLLKQKCCLYSHVSLSFTINNLQANVFFFSRILPAIDMLFIDVTQNE